MFDIRIDNPRIATGSVAVSWCVTRELLERLDQQKVDDPQVLIVTAPVGERYSPSRESRTLAPLKQGLAYAEFHCDGTNRVFAMVVWNSRGRHSSELRDTLLGRKVNWKTDLLTSNGHAFTTDVNYRFNGLNWFHSGWGIILLEPEKWDAVELTDGLRAAVASMDVDVPEGCFAKPPSPREAAWVNHWWRHSPIDQCDYRRRRLWAYSVQPPVMFVNWLIRLVATMIASLALFRGV